MPDFEGLVDEEEEEGETYDCCCCDCESLIVEEAESCPEACMCTHSLGCSACSRRQIKLPAVLFLCLAVVESLALLGAGSVVWATAPRNVTTTTDTVVARQLYPSWTGTTIRRHVGVGVAVLGVLFGDGRVQRTRVGSPRVGGVLGLCRGFYVVPCDHR